MSSPKKFGAFSGVFTPSILTILGVIMYLRLGWVAGVSGLLGVLAIIVLAHVISFTTGLSISSIATDKKIKAGGIYYILSRSLGLSMGGSIGITLFVGTALSISMYIVGFTESFLAIPAIAQWIESLGLPVDHMNTVRIIGSTVLLILVIIAFISTDIAIKTQFLILTAIALSLISVFVGFFVHPEMAPKGDMTDFQPFKDFSFEVVFAVFFPAVTGFTAGVAMSGDLKDPKKDIPKGTMWAIIIGFVVYILLGVSFVLFVDREILLNDYNFLMKLAWIPALVVAGIWGATLSSALGGILGGPRILQAVANDKIVPSFLGKGYGVNNEPRTALILTFLLSEIGVLIGDLNIIAGIVTMFYLTAYGFINLAFSLEKWASTDFRPSFKVPVWVGVIGFVASFMIMFKLDMVSMFIALMIVLGIYYYINKKRLDFRGVNVWHSVYISLVKTILSKLTKEKTDERSWRPNVLLFSGGTRVRPHLLEFGKYMVAKQGLISNFDLIENKEAEALFGKNKLTEEEKRLEISEGIFSRRQECRDIYEGIEAVSAVYGFSGIEPNTVLLGWAKHSTDPVRFVKMIRQLQALDLNIVLLDYDKKRAFGQYELIDVWWRGGSNNGNLMLALIKFIKSSYEWRNAKVRIMIVNPVNEKRALIERDATQVLLNMRLEAEIRVINNEIESRSIFDIIKQESVNSDLVFLGIPEVVENKEQAFIDTIDKLCRNIGTTVLVKASSLFKELHIGMVPGKLNEQSVSEDKNPKILPRLKPPIAKIASLEVIRIYEEVSEVVDEMLFEELHEVMNGWTLILTNVKKSWKSYYTGLHRKIKESDKDLRLFIINQNLQLVAKLKKQVKDFHQEALPQQNERVKKLALKYEQLKQKLASIIPDNILLEYSNADIKMLKAAGLLSSSELKVLKKKRTFKIDFRKVKEQVFLRGFSKGWLEMLKELDYRIFDLERSFNRMIALIEEYQPGKHYSHLEVDSVLEVLKSKEKSFNKILRDLEQKALESEMIVSDVLNGEVIRLFNKMSMLLETPQSVKKLKKVRIRRQEVRRTERLIHKFPSVWNTNRQLISNVTFASIYLLSLKLRLRAMVIDHLVVLKRSVDRFEQEVILPVENQIKKVLKERQELNQLIDSNLVFDKEAFEKELFSNFKMYEQNIEQFIKEFPEKILLFTDAKYNEYRKYEFSRETTIEIKFVRLVTFIVDQELFNPLQKTLTEVLGTFEKHVVELKELLASLKQPEKDKKTAKEEVHHLSLVLEKTEGLKKEMKDFSETVELSLNERLNAVWDKLRISTLTIQNEVINNSLREYQERERKVLWTNFLKKLKR